MSAGTKVAVVGAGAWGRQHTRVFAARPDVDVVAVFSRSAERAAGRAAEVGARPYTDLIEMVERERPDLVSVCLPNEEHFGPTRELLGTGVPLLVEKPLAFSLDEADTLLAQAERRRTFFAINFNHRYAKPVQLAAAAVARGDLGRLTFATWRFGGEGGAGTHPHRNLIETQCHGFDLLEHLCGPITSVLAEVSDDVGDGQGTVALALRFAGGALGCLVGSYESSYAYPRTHYLEVNGTDGRVLVEDTVRRFTYSRAGSELSQVWEAGYFNDVDREFHRTFDRHVDAVLAALREGREPPVPARAGRRALELALAAIASAETGRRVSTASATRDM